MNDDEQLIQALLGELRYVLNTGDLRDSEKNSRELRDRAAQRVGYAGYADFDAHIDSE
jgi:hypothetical protein